jgi:hypothetical protein
MLPAGNTVAANFFDLALIHLHSKRITLSHVSVQKKKPTGDTKLEVMDPDQELKIYTFVTKVTGASDMKLEIKGLDPKLELSK